MAIESLDDHSYLAIQHPQNVSRRLSDAGKSFAKVLITGISLILHGRH